jgi:hypothetical protein
MLLIGSSRPTDNCIKLASNSLKDSVTKGPVPPPVPSPIGETGAGAGAETTGGAGIAATGAGAEAVAIGLTTSAGGVRPCSGIARMTAQDKKYMYHK